MVIYEVNLAVEPDAAEAYAAWLGPHIQEVLLCDGFLSAEWLRVEPDVADDAGEGGPVRWCIQYRLRDRAALDAYLAGPAARLRADGVARFGGRFTATRRVLSLARPPNRKRTGND